MLKVGIIGLGDIASKAYLPVMSNRHLEVHLFTRDKEKLDRIGSQYRFENRHRSLDSLIASGINAAFVHTSTSSHRDIVQALLENNIHVYVDKPVTYDYSSTEKLVALAAVRNLILMCGFNRRYAPAYTALKDMKDVNMIIMQKNRNRLPEEARRFVFDDFIHVIDTLLFLLPHPPARVIVTGRKDGQRLMHVVLQMSCREGETAIGIMNRNSGTTEERLEVFSPHEKRVVDDLTVSTTVGERAAVLAKNSGWMSTLYKRGFEQITDAFLQMAAGSSLPVGLHDDVLDTHRMCEEVVRQLS